MGLNKRRKYSNFKPFNDCCATALHEAKDVWVESLGATIRTGSEIDFIVCNPQTKNEKKMNRSLKYAIKKGKASNSTVVQSMRPTRTLL